MKNYVLGLVFCGYWVALIHKTKGPSYVVGTWNGIGGKIESNELPAEAMTREWFEETGLPIEQDEWEYFAVQRGQSWDGEPYSLHMFRSSIKSDLKFLPPDIKNNEGEGEIVQWHSMLYEIPKVTPNLKWIIPLARDGTTGFLKINEGP